MRVTVEGATFLLLIFPGAGALLPITPRSVRPSVSTPPFFAERQAGQELPPDVAGKFKILTCSASSCAKKRKALGQDEFSTFSEFYMRAKELAPTMAVEETSCLGCCKAAPCVAIEHEDYEGPVSVEGMTPSEFSDRVFHSICFDEDFDRVWSAVENAVMVLAAEEEDGGGDDEHDAEERNVRDVYDDGGAKNTDEGLPSPSAKRVRTVQTPIVESELSPEEMIQMESTIDEILGSISDTEAVLACRAYLVKRKRWTDENGGWMEWSRRKYAQQQTADDETTGFFWEDLSQLRYWDPLSSPLRRANESANVDEIEMDGEVEEDNVVVSRHSSDTDASVALVGADATISLAAWNAAYREEEPSPIAESMESTLTLEDPEPSPEHLRRSDAARRKFTDPEWKDHWYERRWGRRDRRGVNEERLHQRLSSMRQSSTQAEMLAPLANMSETEIAEAIVEYVSANKKRSESRRAWVKRKEETKKQRQKHSTVMKGTADPHLGYLPRDALLSEDTLALEAKQKKYSERGRRAYRTRLERQARANQKATRSRTKNDPLPISPEDFLTLAEKTLEKGELPKIQWIENALYAKEQSRLKNLLLQILRRKFGMKGRLRLPTDGCPPPLRQRSAYQLGEYCSYLLLEKLRRSDRTKKGRAEKLEHARQMTLLRSELNISTSEPEDCLKLIEYSLEKGVLPLVSWVKTLTESKRISRRREVFLALLDMLGVNGSPWLPTEVPPLLTERSIDDLGENCIQLMRKKSHATSSAHLSKIAQSAPVDSDLMAVPAVALRLIEQALANGTLPEADWIEHAMKTKKLKGRREVFLRLLFERFQVYGRQWLPVDDQRQGDTPPFISLRSVQDLGKSCTILVRKSQTNHAS